MTIQASKKYLGPVFEVVQMKGGEFKLCKVELWTVNGERSFGEVLEEIRTMPVDGHGGWSWADGSR